MTKFLFIMYNYALTMFGSYKILDNAVEKYQARRVRLSHFISEKNPNSMVMLVSFYIGKKTEDPGDVFLILYKKETRSVVMFVLFYIEKVMECETRFQIYGYWIKTSKYEGNYGQYALPVLYT